MSNRAVEALAGKAKAASRSLALIDTKLKDRALTAMAAALKKNASYIMNENRKDLALAKKKGLSPALIDRLTLNKKRIASMADSLYQIAKLKDPV